MLSKSRCTNYPENRCSHGQSSFSLHARATAGLPFGCRHTGNNTKSLAMRIGPRFNADCQHYSLLVNVCSLLILWNILAYRYFRCTFEEVKLSVLTVYMQRVKLPFSEIRTVVQGLLSAHITYASEALPFLKYDIHRLDDLTVRSLCKICNVYDRENISHLRKFLNVPCLDYLIEVRKQRFMDKLISLDHFQWDL